MQILTHFDLGDPVYILIFNTSTQTWIIKGPLTIGQVNVRIADSPGNGDPDQLFDNYKPQRRREESYMCVETGIGTGYLYSHMDMFLSLKDAVTERRYREKCQKEKEKEMK